MDAEVPSVENSEGGSERSRSPTFNDVENLLLGDQDDVMIVSNESSHSDNDKTEDATMDHNGLLNHAMADIPPIDMAEEGGGKPGGFAGVQMEDSEIEVPTEENNSEAEADMEGILEGIVTRDGQMEVSMDEEEQYFTPAGEDSPESTPGSRSPSVTKSPGKRPASKSVKMTASKSVGLAKTSERNHNGETKDDQTPTTLEEKKRRLEEFQNGTPKKHKIKASKMVKLKEAQDSPRVHGESEDAIVLSSDDEEDDNPGSFGMKDGPDDEEGDLIEGNLPAEAIAGRIRKQKVLDLPYHSEELKKRPVMANAQGAPVARELVVGERVYCEFKANKQFYWGRIVNRHKKKCSRFFKYHVLFDDGDEDLDVSSTKMLTVTEYIEGFGENAYRQAILQTGPGSLPALKASEPPLPLPPRAYAAAADQPMGVQVASRMGTQELLESACGACENCIKPSCGSCGICKATGVDNDRCCYKKMCCQIAEESKLQTYAGLPDGMGFCFKERKSNPEYEGLLLVSKGGRKYKSFESCFFKRKPDEKTIEKFYSFVGLKNRYKGGGTVNSGAPGGTSARSGTLALPEERMSRLSKPGSVKTLTPHELWAMRCKKCQNCMKPDCAKCICCRGNKRDPTAKNCCYQKMCLEIDLAARAQPAPSAFGNFPEGWTFAFDVTRADVSHLEGLIIFPPAPNPRKYASLERAVNHNKTALANVDQAMFYSYVGLPQNGAERKATESNGGSSAGQAKRPATPATSQATSKKARVIAADASVGGLSLRALYERRCRNCSMCRKPSCNECHPCKDNTSQTRTFKDVCFQKMCCEIKEVDKVQPAKGFPPGWSFYYTDPGKLCWHSSGEHTGLAGLVLLSPTGRQFNSVESAEVALDSDADVPTIARTFYGHVGCHAIVAVTDHVLLGKPFRQKWVDVEGKTKMVYGKIVDVTEDLLSGGVCTCTVQFSDKSRSLLNAAYTPNGATIPARQKIPQTLAFGGCLDCDPRAVRSDKVPYHLSWNVPDVRHEDFVVDEHGMYAPRLTMQFRGFHLVFTAKTSTIPNAGKGVFVSCTTLTGSSDDVFVLSPGELLDFGVYAPFRRSDKKSAHIFLMKNFIHSSQCEEWNFDTVLDDNLFDITDDATGKLHEIASRHIPAYVNETDGHFPATVFAQHDPEGCVHYLLGHGSEGDGSFTLQANGIEEEIWIDYGETYEDVRVRKHYSRLSDEDADERRRQLDLDYKEVLEEIKTYNASEIIQCVNFMMKDVFYPNRSYPVSAVMKALLVTVLFRKRAEDFVDEFASLPINIDDENDTASVCHNGFSRDRMELVIRQSKKLIKSLFQFCNSWHQVKETLLSNEMYRTSLEYVLGESDFDAMTPDKFGELIIGQQPYLSSITNTSTL